MFSAAKSIVDSNLKKAMSPEILEAAKPFIKEYFSKHIEKLKGEKEDLKKNLKPLVDAFLITYPPAAAAMKIGGYDFLFDLVIYPVIQEIIKNNVPENSQPNDSTSEQASKIGGYGYQNYDESTKDLVDCADLDDLSRFIVGGADDPPTVDDSITDEPLIQQVESPTQPVKPLMQPVESPIQPVKPLMQTVESPIQPVKPLMQPVEPLMQPVETLIQPVEPLIQPTKKEPYTFAKYWKAHKGKTIWGIIIIVIAVVAVYFALNPPNMMDIMGDIAKGIGDGVADISKGATAGLKKAGEGVAKNKNVKKAMTSKKAKSAKKFIGLK